VTKKYPDVSALLNAKAERRRRLVRLTIEEKIAIVNKWRELTMHIQKLRHGGHDSPSEKVEDAK
jgi:hypothetical protein